ncbi:hypothetical protein D3C86_1265800 [compost metagenome]
MSVALLLGTAIPMLLGGLVSYALPFSSGVLHYVALAELIPASATTALGTGLVLAGAAGFWVIEKLLAHVH